MRNSGKFGFDTEEIALISSALGLFVTSKIESMPFDLEREHNNLAISASQKLSNRETKFSLEDLRIMAIALFNLQAIIEETGLASTEIASDSDTEKYLSMISDILDALEEVFNAHGFSIFHDN